MYLANHCPSLPGHPRRYTFGGRGHSFCFFRFLGKPVLAVTTPFYEKDIAVQDVRFANNLIALFGEIVKEKRTLPQRYWNCRMEILPVALYWDLVKELPSVKFYPADDIVMNLRARKSLL